MNSRTAGRRPAGHGGARLTLAGTAGGVALVMSLTACAAGGTAQVAKKETLVPKLTILPADGTAKVRPGAEVTVRAANGTVQAVHVQAGKHQVTGQLTDNDTLWRSVGPLSTSRTFTVTATASGSGGKTVTQTSSFSTLKPKKTFQASTVLGYGMHYGVGMPIILNFNRPIKRKAAVEKAITLRTSKHVTGAWYWDGDKTLYFRPRTYWPQHTKVTFNARLNGVEGAKGVYGTRNLKQSFTIGNSLIVVASTRTHYMKVYYKRHLWRTWAISTGRPGDDTPNGTYVTIDKGNPVEMKGPGYDLMVPYSVRFTWSGDYIHDAYWSVGEQGHTNVSHGCVNTSPAHAAIYYNMAVPGDPVTVTGSPKGGTWGNGYTVWFLTWKKLLAGSATHMAVKSGPGGSKLVSPDTLTAVHAKAPVGRPSHHNFWAR
ncbi:MAG TPA: Ig-like domain-containing protein [Streptosporangiaceae bacterium]|nr:Ig-like domain-containing protein [Streptosporangiaceae bacterium]